MPRGDRTGPMGMGPMTGRAAGYCAGYSVPGFSNPQGGRYGRGMAWGRGFGWGRGRVWGRWGGYPMAYPYSPAVYEPGPYAPTYTPEHELEFLQNQAKVMADQLNEIQKRISELESKSSKKEK